MIAHQTKYELLQEEKITRQKHNYTHLCLLVALCTVLGIAIYSTWTYRNTFYIPPNDIPEWLSRRAIQYANHYSDKENLTNNSNLINSDISNNNNNNNNSINNNNSKFNKKLVKELENEKIYPSKYGNFISSKSLKSRNGDGLKLVCYYTSPTNPHTSTLYPRNIDPHLCTHLNVGLIQLDKNQINLDDTVIEMIRQSVLLKRQNPNLKILIWVGGGGDGSDGFSEMIRNHDNRKVFIKSLKTILETYHLDGIDIDWEFPSALDRERQHFSQLLHEIRREYQREHRTYLLSIAVAAIEGIAYFAYDIDEINSYVDYVNIMTYDFHTYSRHTPFTGLNSPLYPRHNEKGILSTLNINASVNYWLTNGLDKSKIIIGLPTYGHSFKLVNPFNTKIGSPAEDYGSVGSLGFVTYSDVCWFKTNHFYVTSVFDVETCSPYVFAGNEWISYEDEKSLECKTNFIKSNGFGGAMLFSLNTDDYSSYCAADDDHDADRRYQSSSELFVKNATFPLARKIYSILFHNKTNV